VIPKGCRLERCVEALTLATDADSVRRLTDEERHIIGEAGRTVFELYLATHRQVDKPSNEICQKFGEAILGADLARDERDHFARNIQFELYLWGLFGLGSGRCEYAEPPDLISSYHDTTIGIAAKRIWSQEQAHKRLTKAADQIEAAGIPGIIAVNAQEYLTVDAAVAELATKGNAFNKDVVRLHGQFPEIAKKHHVLGLLLTGSTYRWDVPQDRAVEFNVSVYHQLLLLTDDSEQERLAISFSRERMEAFATWVMNNL
jgi:hypothetical protein